MLYRIECMNLKAIATGLQQERELTGELITENFRKYS